MLAADANGSARYVMVQTCRAPFERYPSSPSPRSFNGEKVGMRGGVICQRWRLPPPLTLTLSPLAGRGEEFIAVENREVRMPTGDGVQKRQVPQALASAESN